MTSTPFSDLSLSPAMLDNLKSLDFVSMTPVQAQSLPPILAGRDVIAQAKTGSGKTLSFGLGLLSKLDVSRWEVQALVLCPTRELAEQVTKELRRLARFASNIKILTLCGGTSLSPQITSLEHRAHVVVGTPGRVLKHLNIESLLLSGLTTFVLDEAHRMLEMGFISDIKEIISYAPDKRQTLFFSATYPDKILELSNQMQQDAVEIKTIEVDNQSTIDEYFYEVSTDSKFQTLINVIAHHKPSNVIIFCNTKIQAKDLAKELRKRSIEALALHGDLEQYARADVLMQFSNQSCCVLLATDLAARGLDIAEMGMVINYDMPQDEAIYTHRIGRTGRAGKSGVAATLFAVRQTPRIDAYLAKHASDTCRLEETANLKAQRHFKFDAPNVTLVIEGGRKDKVRAGDLLGALTGDAGIPGKAIGKIDIRDHQSYVAVEKGLIEKAFNQLKQGRIKGKKFPVWVLSRGQNYGGKPEYQWGKG